MKPQSLLFLLCYIANCLTPLFTHAVDDTFQPLFDGKIIDSQDEVGGWDRHRSVSRAPGFDTDQDGMPDAWEGKLGLNSDDQADGNKDHNNDGFTNLEQYINSLTHP
jgi:hypothetical protein